MFNWISSVRFYLKSYKEDDSGVAATEFAIISIAFLTLVFGIIEAGRIMWTMNSVEYAVENAARFAITNQDATESEIVDIAEQSLAEMFIPSDGFVASVSNVTDAGIDFVEIDASYDYEMFVGVFLPDSLNDIDFVTTVRRPVY